MGGGRWEVGGGRWEMGDGRCMIQHKLSKRQQVKLGRLKVVRDESFQSAIKQGGGVHSNE